MYKIWFENTVPDEFRHLFEAVAEGISPGDQVKTDPYYRLEEAHAVMAGGRTYDAAAMDRAERLLLIARTGVGYDKVDIPAATARNIAVVNAPDAPTVSTAEQAVTLMMTVARSIKRVTNELDRMLNSGERKNIWGEYVRAGDAQQAARSGGLGADRRARQRHRARHRHEGGRL